MDPYVYPGTNVLRNLRDIHDLDLLGRFEADATSRRLRQLEHQPLEGSFDTKHLQAIHRYIFQDLFEWAGEVRTVDIARPGQFFFAFPQLIVPCLDGLFNKLKNEQHLANGNRSTFCSRSAYYLGELNAIHPFREGNGRTQREFIRQLALWNGHNINWFRVTREQMYEASHRSFQRGDMSGLEAVLLASIDERA